VQHRKTKIGNFLGKKQGVLEAPHESFGHTGRRHWSIRGQRTVRLAGFCKSGCASPGFTGTLADSKQGVVMTALVQALSRTFHSAKDIDSLKVIVLFCAAGLLVSLLLSTRGLDLSPGFPPAW
jgi:hypothetical protein